MFENIFGCHVGVMLVCTFCGVFGEHVAIASVGVVRNLPIFDSGNLVKLDFQNFVVANPTQHFPGKDLNPARFLVQSKQSGVLVFFFFFVFFFFWGGGHVGDVHDENDKEGEEHKKKKNKKKKKMKE